jgi:hypothetical protein
VGLVVGTLGVRLVAGNLGGGLVVDTLDVGLVAGTLDVGLVAGTDAMLVRSMPNLINSPLYVCPRARARAGKTCPPTLPSKFSILKAP